MRMIGFAKMHHELYVLENPKVPTLSQILQFQ